MGFESVLASDIKVESNELPAGTYTFTLAPKSANVKTWSAEKPQQLSVRVVVADGEYKGRTAFVNFDDYTFPGMAETKVSTAKRALSTFKGVLGAEPNVGESLVDYFNRVAVEVNPKFTGEIETSYIDKKTKETVTIKARVKSFSFRPAV